MKRVSSRRGRIVRCMSPTHVPYNQHAPVSVRAQCRNIPVMDLMVVILLLAALCFLTCAGVFVLQEQLSFVEEE